MDRKEPIVVWKTGFWILAAIQIVGIGVSVWAAKSMDTPTCAAASAGPSAGTDTQASYAVPSTLPANPPEFASAIPRQAPRSSQTNPDTAPGTAPDTFLAAKSSAQENSPENLNADSAATNIVDIAISLRKWTQADSAALQQYRRQLTPEQRYKIVEKLVAAINRQELTLEAPFPSP
jgi:hypothetical protein